MNRTALVVAIVCGAIGFVLLGRHKKRFEAAASGGTPLPVVVARADIPLGATLNSEMVALRELPASYLEARHIRGDQLQKVVGLRTSLAVRAGESLLWTDLAAGHERRDLSGLVLEGMRAVTIRASGQSTFGGLLRPGDRVDVLMTGHGDSGQRTTRPLVQNLLVLAVGTQTVRAVPGQLGFDSGAMLRPRELTLSGTVAQTQTIVHASSVAQLSVVLRHPEDVAVTRKPPTTRDADLRSETVLEEVQGQRGRRKATPPELPEEIDDDR